MNIPASNPQQKDISRRVHSDPSLVFVLEGERIRYHMVLPDDEVAEMDQSFPSYSGADDAGLTQQPG